MPVIIDLSDEPSPKRAKRDASLETTAADQSRIEARRSERGVEGLSNKELRQVFVDYECCSGDLMSRSSRMRGYLR